MSTTDRDSGAGAYSNVVVSVAISGPPRWPLVQGEVVGSGVAAGGQLLALHEQVVEQARRAEAEQVGVEPLLPRGLLDHHEVADRVLGRADAAGRLDADPAAGAGVEVAPRLEHDQRDRRRRGRRHLAGAGL